MPNTDLTTTFRVNLQSKYINNDDGINVTNVRDNLNYFDIAQKLLEGVGANLANMQHYSRRRLINSIEVLDLETDLTNRWGDVLDFQNIKIGVIVNRQEEENRFLEVTIKGEQYYIGPRGFRVFYEPVDVGLIEVSSSEVPVGNLVVSSDSDITYDLILIGSGDTNLFYIDHETGDLSQYDSTVTDGGDLSVVADGLRNSAFKMQCEINDATSIYGIKSFSVAGKASIRKRFYMDVSQLTMAEADSFILERFRVDTLAKTIQQTLLEFNSSNFEIKLRITDDENISVNGTAFTISAQEHYIELLLTRATTNVASDGTIGLWIDGVFKETITGIDNFDDFILISDIRFGPSSGLDVGTSGQLFLDELIVRDTDSEIGA